MKSRLLLISLATLPLIIACGGGGSSQSNAGTSNTLSTLTGTVPGTKIEAFCNDGKYYYTHSNNNGTSHHPFQLKIKKNSLCTFIMTMNENDPANRTISKIAFDDGSGNPSAQINIIGNNVDMGYINLPQNPSAMNDNDGDHVNDSPITIPLPPEASKSYATNTIYDTNNNGIPDIYDDKNDNGIPDAYDDKNHNGTPDILEDNNQNGIPDIIESQSNNGNGTNGGSRSNNNSSSGNNGAVNGQSLYAANCAACHGSGANSNVKNVSLSRLRNVLRNGKGSMPAFPNVSANDIYAYFVSLNGGGGSGAGNGGGGSGTSSGNSSENDHGNENDNEHEDGHD